MTHTIKVLVTTLSNLFIGGAPAPFEIGGIDQYTVTAQDGYPYIPASSFKGALRGIVREDRSPEAEKIAGLYEDYLRREKEAHWPEIQARYADDAAALERMEKRYGQPGSAEFLFGIEGFNNSPKLLFGDLTLKQEFRDLTKCFSLDAKTSIEVQENALSSNPRTYKAVRGGLSFEGEIIPYKLNLLGEGAAALCADYIRNCLEKFNDGVHRLGNSKSRGYGKVQVQAAREGEVREG